MGADAKCPELYPRYQRHKETHIKSFSVVIQSSRGEKLSTETKFQVLRSRPQEHWHHKPVRWSRRTSYQRERNLFT